MPPPQSLLESADLPIYLAVANGAGMFLLLSLLSISYIGPRLQAVRSLRQPPRHEPAMAAVGDAHTQEQETPEPASGAVEAVEDFLDQLSAPEQPDLQASPLDGSPLEPVSRRTGPSGAGRPATRQATTAGAWSATFTDGEPGEESPPNTEQVPVPQLDRPGGNTKALLAAAWKDQDVDQLAAVGAACPEASGAAHVLAAVAALRTHDSRAARHLEAALYDGSDPVSDPFLTPFLSSLDLLVVEPSLGVDELLPLSRMSIGCVLATLERHVGDPEAAYSVLLSVADEPLVQLLRAQAALDLGWTSRALSAARVPGPPNPWRTALQVMEASALAEVFELGLASDLLDAAVAAMTSVRVKGGDALHARALYERAKVRSVTGAADGAASDLRRALELVPTFDAAAALLKSL